MSIVARVFLSLLLIAGSSAHATPPWSSLGEAVAIQGYDTVAYFAKSEAVRGSVKFVHEWNGMSWFFSSTENRDAFAAEPTKYAPQFGGFCALSVAGGKNARGAGDAWTIHNGRLYLNYDKEVAARFQSDISGGVSKAEGWWPTVKSRIEKQ